MVCSSAQHENNHGLIRLKPEWEGSKSLVSYVNEMVLLVNDKYGNAFISDI